MKRKDMVLFVLTSLNCHPNSLVCVWGDMLRVDWACCFLKHVIFNVKNRESFKIEIEAFFRTHAGDSRATFHLAKISCLKFRGSHWMAFSIQTQSFVFNWNTKVNNKMDVIAILLKCSVLYLVVLCTSGFLSFWRRQFTII